MDPVSALGAGVGSAIVNRIASKLLGGPKTGNADPTPVDQQQFEQLLKMASDSTAASGSSANAATGSVAKASEIESTSSTGGVITNAVESDLGKDAFLELLVRQMQNQDPLDPVDNSQMIAQLAQFSSLEQMQNLNASFDTLSGNIDQLNFLSASSMLGKTVSGISSSGSVVEGTVEKIQLDGSVVYLTVNGELLSMAGVLSIEDVPA